MKKIGIYLSISPSYGGTYQYSLSIIDAISRFDRKKYSVSSFVNDKGWLPFLPEHFQKCCMEISPTRWFMGKIYRRLDKSAEGMTRFAKIFNPLLSCMDKSGCDLVVFPNQDEESCQTRCPSLVAIHDIMHRYEPQFPEYGGGVYEKRERLYKNICETAKGILVDSELGKRQVMESYLVEERKIHVLPYLPPSYLYSRKEINVFKKYSLPEKYFFYPAQFWEHKNHDSLIRAFKIMMGMGIDAGLVLCGSKKNNYSKVIALIKELGLKNVTILGYVPNEDMYSMYKNATATVFVSLLGPTNIPPLEAMWVGCPLIVSNVYAMPDQVGDAALLVDPRNPDDIAQKMKDVLTSEELRSTLIAKGKERSSRWTREEFSKKFKQIIEKTLP